MGTSPHNAREGRRITLHVCANSEDFVGSEVWEQVPTRQGRDGRVLFVSVLTLLTLVHLLRGIDTVTACNRSLCMYGRSTTSGQDGSASLPGPQRGGV